MRLRQAAIPARGWDCCRDLRRPGRYDVFRPWLLRHRSGLVQAASEADPGTCMKSLDQLNAVQTIGLIERSTGGCERLADPRRRSWRRGEKRDAHKLAAGSDGRVARRVRRRFWPVVEVTIERSNVHHGQVGGELTNPIRSDRGNAGEMRSADREDAEPVERPAGWSEEPPAGPQRRKMRTQADAELRQAFPRVFWGWLDGIPVVGTWGQGRSWGRSGFRTCAVRIAGAFAVRGWDMPRE